jgi:hypothetical protein
MAMGAGRTWASLPADNCSVQGAAPITAGSTSEPGGIYRRREPETTALYRVLQAHLSSFERRWADPAEGRTLPLLKEMETRESQEPPATRFDFSEIRRSLGIIA